MMSLEDIRVYLPKYLSEESTQDLFESLQGFPSNIDSRLYSDISIDPDVVLQGDGLKELLVVNLPQTQISPADCVVISNTCDINPENPRRIPPNICYCPIFKISKFRKYLSEMFPLEAIETEKFIGSIRSQRVSQIFYLPVGGRLKEESFIYFDKMCSCQNEAVSRELLQERRLFSLSNYGFYLFVFKLSVHFSRIRENLDRKTAV